LKADWKLGEHLVSADFAAKQNGARERDEIGIRSVQSVPEMRRERPGLIQQVAMSSVKVAPSDHEVVKGVMPRQAVARWWPVLQDSLGPAWAHARPSSGASFVVRQLARIDDGGELMDPTVRVHQGAMISSADSSVGSRSGSSAIFDPCEASRPNNSVNRGYVAEDQIRFP
jgi:hypothetical protein